jgi:putative flippase GtrA
MNTEIVRFVVYSVLAVVRTGLDLLIWQLLVWFFQDNFPLVKLAKLVKLNKFALAQAISFVISVIISYYSNKAITYNDKQVDSLSFVLFIIISIVSFVISVWTINFITSNKQILTLNKFHPLLEKFWPQFAKLATIIITLVINYVGYSIWVFK